MFINVADLPGILIAVQCGIFFLILISDRGRKRRSNRILATFLLLLGIQFLAITLDVLSISNFLSWTYCLFGFCYGPLLYLYVRSLAYESIGFKPWDLLHTLPLLLFGIFTIIGISFCQTLGPAFYLSLFIYVALGIKEILTYRKILIQTQSSAAFTDLSWIQWFMILFCTVLVLDVLDQFVLDVTSYYGVSLVHLALLFLVNWITYKGFKAPEIFFMGISESDKRVLDDVTEKREATQQDQADFEIIRNYVETNRSYVNAELSLQDLAGQLGYPAKHVSFVINSVGGKNFMNFINDYRLNEAVHFLNHPSDPGETVNEVMYRVGFNSKSSFFTLFKKKTGYTPSAFKARHQKKTD